MRRSMGMWLGWAIAACLVWISVAQWWPQTTIAQPADIFYVTPTGRDADDGSRSHPWASLNHAAEVLTAGQTVYVRGGVYPLAQQIRVKHAGTAQQPIVFAGYPGEVVTLDAKAISVPPPSGSPPYAHDQGAFQIANVAYITVQNLAIANSHNSGFTVRDSHHITLRNNTTENTFAPGIGVWANRPHATHDIKILGNTVINANDPNLGYPGSEANEPPHESISLGSVEQFEVAYNWVRDGQKEGIDVKETSQHGTVHHNVIQQVKRQGLYVDSWAGVLDDVELFQNVVRGCGGAGFVLSVEDGLVAKNIRFHHNLLHDNWGTGILFGRWGKDGLRERIQIHHNTIHHNGHGKPNPGEKFYWITGGIYLFSQNLQAVEIHDNIVSQNAGFQIGYSDRYVPSKPRSRSPNITPIFQRQQIRVFRNFIDDRTTPPSPIEAGWRPNDWATIYPFQGKDARTGDPQFIDPQHGNFYLHATSPAIRDRNTYHGAFPPNPPDRFWWQKNFPPQFSDPIQLNGQF